jgi:hypothetical protein
MQDSRDEGQRMRKYGFLFAMVFLLSIPTKGNAQEVSNTDPDIVRLRTANALRAGDIDLALKGFVPDSQREDIIRALDHAQRNLLAHEIENAELILTAGTTRFYRYNWTDETGDNFIEFTMVRDDRGKWVIASW